MFELQFSFLDGKFLHSFLCLPFPQRKEVPKTFQGFRDYQEIVRNQTNKIFRFLYGEVALCTYPLSDKVCVSVYK